MKFQQLFTPTSEQIDVVARAYWTLLGRPQFDVTGFDSDDMIDDAINALNPDSSPGFPLMYHSATNKEVVSNPLHNASLRLMVKTRLQSGTHGLVRVFVKREPHSLKKVSEGRYRLISSVSAQDQVVERLLHSYLDEYELKHFER
jgi:hypothetical protein